jgi:hypothetical protein
MTRLFKRFRRRRRAYCLACDKTAPSGPPELVLAGRGGAAAWADTPPAAASPRPGTTGARTANKASGTCSVQQLLETGRSPSALEPDVRPNAYGLDRTSTASR